MPGLSLSAHALLLALLQASPDAAPEPRPQAPADSLLTRLKLEAGVDVFAAYNPHHPADHANFFPGTGTSAKRAGEVGLNLASVGVSLAPEPVGFRVLLGVGSSLAVVHGGEPAGPAVGPQVWYPLQEASVRWAVSDVLTLQAGVYPSHIGFEVLPTQANWTYTRAWMSELSPYYQAGVMVQLQLGTHWNIHLHLLNGWQVIGDTNRSPALGTKLAYSADRFTVAFNTFVGREPVGAGQGLRLFGDIVATARLTSRLQLAGSVDAAWQERPGRAAAHWVAGALDARYQVAGAVAVAARAEVFDDRDGAISGTAQRLVEGTLTVEVRPVEHLVLKLEGRRDVSTAAVFATRAQAPDGTPVRAAAQSLLVLGTTVSWP